MADQLDAFQEALTIALEEQVIEKSLPMIERFVWNCSPNAARRLRGRRLAQLEEDGTDHRAPDPLMRASDNEGRERMRAAIQQCSRTLSDEGRHVLELMLEGESASEIGRRVAGCPTLGQYRVRRVIDHVRAALLKCGAEEVAKAS